MLLICFYKTVYIVLEVGYTTSVHYFKYCSISFGTRVADINVLFVPCCNHLGTVKLIDECNIWYNKIYQVLEASF